MLRSGCEFRKLIPKQSLKQSIETESEQNSVDYFRKEGNSFCSALLLFLRQDYGYQQGKTSGSTLERDLLLLAPGEGEGCWNVPMWAPFPGRSGPCRSCFGHPAPAALRRPDLEVGKRQAESASRRASEEGVENCLELTETEKTQLLQLTAGQEDGSSWATNPPNDLQNSFRRQPATQRRRPYSNPFR